MGVFRATTDLAGALGNHLACGREDEAWGQLRPWEHFPAYGLVQFSTGSGLWQAFSEGG